MSRLVWDKEGWFSRADARNDVMRRVCFLLSAGEGFIASVGSVFKRFLTKRALAGITTKMAAAMTACQYSWAGLAAEHQVMLKRVTLERTAVATFEYTTAGFVAATRETEPLVGFHDGKGRPMVRASNGQAIIQVEPTL